MDPSTIERMRESYKRAEKHLIVGILDEDQIVNRIFHDEEMKKRDELIRQLTENFETTTQRLQELETKLMKKINQCTLMTGSGCFSALSQTFR